MRRLLKFFRLPPADRRLWVRAALLLWAIRLGLWLLPFHRLRRLLERKTPPNIRAREIDRALVAKITRSVKVMSRYVPAATCLTQALATLVLLGESGEPACLRIGVAQAKTGKLEAHAWIESGGRVVIGGTRADLARYTVLRHVEEL